MNILDRYELQPTTGGYRFRDTTNPGPSGLLKCTMTEALLYELLRVLSPQVEIVNVDNPGPHVPPVEEATEYL